MKKEIDEIKNSSKDYVLSNPISSLGSAILVISGIYFIQTQYSIISVIAITLGFTWFFPVDSDHYIVSGLISGLIVAFVLSSPLSPATDPILQSGNYDISSGDLDFTMHNIGREGADLEIRVGSYGAEFSESQNRTILPKESTRITFSGLKGEIRTTDSYHKTIYEILDRPKVENYCSNLSVGESKEITSDIMNVTYVENSTKWSLPAFYNIRAFEDKNDDPRHVKVFKYPEEIEILESKLEFHSVSPEIKRTSEFCNLSPNVDGESRLSWFRENETYDEYYWYFDKEKYPRPDMTK